jgi:hypothetical protein
VILGEDNKGIAKRVGLVDSGVATAEGQPIYELATDATLEADIWDSAHHAFRFVPVTQTALGVCSTTASSGDNTVITGTPLKKIVLTSIILQNESVNPVTMILYDGASPTTPLLRCLAEYQGDGIALVSPSDVRRKLTAGNSLILNLSGAYSCGYSIDYYLE